MEEKGFQVVSGFWLKLLAIAFMTLDHVGLFLMARYQGVNEGLFQMAYVFRCLGRIAMPLFALLCAEGVRHSRNPWAYVLRIALVYAGISVAMSIAIYGIPSLNLRPSDITGNAFADLLMLALFLALLRQKNAKSLLALLPLGVIVATFVVQTIEHVQDITIHWFPAYLRPSYSLLGFCIGVGFYFASPIADKLSRAALDANGITLESYRDTKAYRKIVNLIGNTFFFLAVVAFWAVSYINAGDGYRPYDVYVMPMQSYCLLAMVPAFIYSGKRGYDSRAMRVITYAYYPVHLAILFAIFSL